MAITAGIPRRRRVSATPANESAGSVVRPRTRWEWPGACCGVVSAQEATLPTGRARRSSRESEEESSRAGVRPPLASCLRSASGTCETADQTNVTGFRAPTGLLEGCEDRVREGLGGEGRGSWSCRVLLRVLADQAAEGLPALDLAVTSMGAWSALCSGGVWLHAWWGGRAGGHCCVARIRPGGHTTRQLAPTVPTVAGWGGAPCRATCRPGLVTIRASKFGKSREVPLHPSTIDALAGYARRRDQLSLPCGCR